MTHPLHTDIDQSSYWPYEFGSIPRHETGDPGAAWKLGIDAGGSVVLWPGKEPFPEELGLIPAYFHDSREALEDFFVMCVLGWESDPRHAYQDGRTYLLPLSWRSYTLGQVTALSRIVHARVTGKDAWAVAQEWAKAIEAGLDKLVAASGT